jgi:two-component system, chemotaxis family, CheB/CheR fusion protein
MGTDSAPGDESKQRSDPSEGAAGMLVVGIGASAGGLEALGHFFSNMPPDSGMAFVVITHAPSGRNSLMPELLSRQTAMTVAPVTTPVAIEPNHIYLAPGGEQLLLREGRLYAAQGGRIAPRHYIDVFFRSLAAEFGNRAVGIVLSGTGTDGTLGIQEIKAQGGMTMAQDEGSARYAAMPHSAIASLQVDHVLSAPEMPKQLVSYAGSALRRLEEPPAEPEASASDHYARVFALLRSRTGHDFSHYKGTTIRRRIERRMNVHQLESVWDYVQFLQNNAVEVDRLFKELLIGVTSFFRDPEAHELLCTTVLPELLNNRPDSYTLRIWVAGCSTGEEAYTLAIEVKEAMEQAKRHLAVQIFATDLDPDAIEVARLGEYPESIATDVSAQRLARYFTLEEGGFYRIRKEIREMLVFAPHSLIEDPPFTKLDLLSCRNLLIYLDGRLQQQLLPVFHYSLRPGGILFLGSSETVGGFGHLFDAVDKKWKIFRRREVASGGYLNDLPLLPSDSPIRETAGAPLLVPRSGDHGLAQSAERALLQQLLPPCVIMHERGEIVHIHGRTGLFLEPAQGTQGTSNVYNMAREGLQLDLAVAVRHAAGSETAIVHRGVRVKTNGHHVSVDLRVKKLTQPENLRGLFLVAFERVEPVNTEQPRPSTDGVSLSQLADRTTELERELSHAKEVHQSTIEELETTNEELKSTNEELQSTNEELQSANEELETSKEEMQSLNEELQTVNAELEGKVEELSRANDDMKNLLNGTDIATIFLDGQLNIKRYTDQARKVIRLIPSDVGRPVGDLVSKLRYRSLTEDAEEVLRSLACKETDVQSEDGTWYLMRMLPYRTTGNVIDGLVVTFVDITKVRGLQEESRRLIRVLERSPTGIFGQDTELRYDWAFGNMLGRPAGQLLGKTDAEVFGELGQALVAAKREVIASGEALRRRIPLAVERNDGEYDVYLQPVRTAAGEMSGLCGVLTAIEAPRRER